MDLSGASARLITSRYLAKDEMAMIGKREWVKEVGLAKKAEGTNHRDTINWNLTLFWGKDVSDCRRSRRRFS